ncbi:class I fructose-bisphosphate aldolase [Thiolapillus sp.]
MSKPEIQEKMMSSMNELQQTIADMVDDHRGILAMDESLPTIQKRFEAISPHVSSSREVEA